MKSPLLSLACAVLIVTSATACGSTAATPSAEKTESAAAASPSASASPSVAPATPSPSAAATDTAKPADEGQNVTSPCRTDDLSFKVTEQSQAGGYYLITATAKPGVSCTLRGETAAVAFGSAEDAHAGPAEQAVGPSVEVSGDKKAYAGVSPKSGNVEGGVLYPQIIVSATNDDPNPVSIKLPTDAEVAGPVATNWVAKAGDAVPF